MTDLSSQPEIGTGLLHLALARRLVAEAIGAALLIVAVIGSGIMASRLSPTDVGLQLLENAAATAGALIGLILMFGAVSGAHFNPAVTLVDRMFGTISTDQPVHQITILGCAVAVGSHRHNRTVARHTRLCPHRPRRRRAVRRWRVDW
jgi:hypothetical protein